jgi:hypothetical protein
MFAGALLLALVRRLFICAAEQVHGQVIASTTTHEMLLQLLSRWVRVRHGRGVYF